jgi:single-stranded-DNA-specific exonuclease
LAPAGPSDEFVIRRNDVLRSKARWKLNDIDADAVSRLTRELNVHPVVARLLVARGIADPAEAERFIYGGKDHFHDPFSLDGMEAAVERIREAVRKREKIRIYGDYDADGVCSTALMTHLFRFLEAHFDYYIPHRTLEGYGLNRSALEQAKHDGVSLIVTVDTGISACEEVAYAAELGIDVVVTDHHEPPDRLPAALAVVNPKKPGCPYPFKQLAGVGVAFKLAHALLDRLPESFLELAALGTVADLMPLVDENRLMVKLGLERMQNSGYPGIRALLRVSGIAGKTVAASHIGFALAPRINACGRLDHAGDAVKLLTTDDEGEADAIAANLDRLNKERQRIAEQMTGEALELLDKTRPGERRGVIVLAKENWNVGVIGIVAARLLEKFYLPTVLLSVDPDTGIAKGSARSIAGFDIYKALSHCAGLLDHFGGHQAAAGMTLHRDRVPHLSESLNELAEAWLTEEDYIPLYNADAGCELSDVSIDSIRQIESLAPFGIGNPPPKFVLSGLEVRDKRLLGKERQHLKLTLAQTIGETACTVEAVGFGRGTLSDFISPTAKIDVLAELSINEWNGTQKPQIVIEDMRIPHVQVFDWRDGQPFGPRLAEWTDRLRGSDDGDRDGRGLIHIIGDGNDIPADCERLGCALWALGGNDGVRPQNDAARRCVWPEAESIVLYSLPDDPDMLRAALGTARRAARVFAVFAAHRRDRAVLPTRDMFKRLYRLLVQKQTWTDDASFYEAVRDTTGFSFAAIRFMLEVFEELAFIERVGVSYRAVPSPQKRELDTSETYRRRLRAAEAERLLLGSTSRELAEWIWNALPNNPFQEGIS